MISIELKNQSISHIRILCDYAYHNGFHELGYDPIQELEEYISELEKEVVQLRGENR